MNQALAKIRILLGEQIAEWQEHCFRYVQTMRGAKSVFSRIASTNDKEQIEDYLVEILFAILFSGLRFEVEFEPLGRKGPDLQVTRDDEQMLVEIRRFRKIYPGPPAIDIEDKNPILHTYGNPPRDVRKSFEKILSKFTQVHGHHSIIAIWNDDEDLEEVEVRTAVNDISIDVGNGILSIPKGLLFVLYGSKWVGRNKQLHCFPLGIIEEPFLTWKTEIEHQLVSKIIRDAICLPETH